MAAPNDGGYGQYPPQQYTDQQLEYAATSSPPPPPGAHNVPDHGKKKKRAYAAGAFEVGAGGNAVGGQQPGGGLMQPGGPSMGYPQPVAPGLGGYPQPDAAQAPLYGAAQPSYPVPQPGAPGMGGGYPAPAEPYYQGPGAPVAPGGVAGLTSGFGAMQIGGGAAPVPGLQQQQPQQLPPQARAGPLNQLYPTDLLNQPFNVSELELPPPPIILPANVRAWNVKSCAISS